ncbi:MAG: glutathione S-transferase N-terminal domain-containing protein [Parvibaculum sp.]|nr:glutathione S-transferase N-terminal domain-containing protein [Parvibaculum sp.]
MGIATGMKMYNAQLSPYATRCRMAIYAKDLDVEFLDMPDPDLEQEFHRVAPMGKVPVLIDGDVIVPESETICEYLEDKGLGWLLRPTDAASACGSSAGSATSM